MKMLKVIGMTSLISGVTCLGAYWYNCARWEKSQRLWMTEEFVLRHNIEKYNELTRAGVDDFDTWMQARTEIEDSIKNEKIARDEACRAYFEALQNMESTQKSNE